MCFIFHVPVTIPEPRRGSSLVAPEESITPITPEGLNRDKGKRRQGELRSGGAPPSVARQAIKNPSSMGAAR